MNKIWRSNDLEEEDARPSSHHETREGEHGPDEHTRLLPNRVESTQGVYLSPDDPAVSTISSSGSDASGITRVVPSC